MSKGGAWQRYDLVTRANGSIDGCCSTNDDLDHGVPTEYAEWGCRYPNRKSMELQTGGCHTGISGIVVEVYLDGVKLEPPHGR